MTEKALRELAHKEAVIRLRRYNEARRSGEYQIAPFILQNFLAGVDFAILQMRPSDGTKKFK